MAAIQFIAAEFASRVRRWTRDIERLREFGDFLTLKEEENELIPTKNSSPFVQYYRVGYYTVRIHFTADGLESISMYRTYASFLPFRVTSDNIDSPNVTTYDDVEPFLRNMRSVEFDSHGVIFATDREGFSVKIWPNSDNEVPGADAIMEIFAKNGDEYCVACKGNSLVAVFLQGVWHTCMHVRRFTDPVASSAA